MKSHAYPVPNSIKQKVAVRWDNGLHCGMIEDVVHAHGQRTFKLAGKIPRNISWLRGSMAQVSSYNEYTFCELFPLDKYKNVQQGLGQD